MGQPTWGQAASPPPKKTRRLLLVAIGLFALVAGIVVFVLAGARYASAVKELAAAPVGCKTTLDFDGGGTFILFVETKGEVGEIDGDCASSGRRYEYDGEALPRVNLTLLDDGGEEIDLDRVDEPTYDVGGRVGAAVRTTTIDSGGSYVLSVESNESDVVVRVGKDPERGVSTMRTLGTALGVAGLALVVLGLILGRSRRQPQPAGPTPGPIWTPSGGPPPVAPPQAGAPTRPPYVTPPQPYPPQPYPPQGYPPRPPGSGRPLPPPTPGR